MPLPSDNPLLRSTGQAEVMDLLRQHRIDVHAVTGVFVERLPLHWCVYWDWPDAAREVLAQGASVEALGSGDETPLGIAIAHAARGDANPAMVQVLLEAGASMDRPDADGLSAWERVRIEGSPELVAVFQEHRVTREQALLRTALGTPDVPPVAPTPGRPRL